MSARGVRRPSWVRRALAALAGVTLLVSLALAPSAQVSDAAFTDDEQAQTTLTARLLPPQVTSIPLCSRPPLTGGTFMQVTWQWPAVAPYSSFTGSNVEWRVGTLVVTPTVTGPDGQGRYTADITTGLLSGLLGGLLGADVVIEMRTTYGTWRTNTTPTTVTYNAPLVTGAATCTPVNGT